MSGFDILSWILIFLGFFATVIPPFVQINKKLDKNQFLSNIGFPVSAGLVTLLLGVLGYSWNHYDETILSYMIFLILLGSIGISITGSIVYTTRARYAT